MLALSSTVSASAAAPPTTQVQALNDSVAEWQRLRALRGHFSGGPWRDDVDRYGGAKHQVMRLLSEQLVAENASEATVLNRLGPPDMRWGPTTPRRQQAEHPPTEPCAANRADALSAANQWWVYRWRGQHDMLVLAMVNHQALACAWLHDGE